MRVNTDERVRGTYLGGHEIATLAGANPWGSVADLYARYVLGAPVTVVNDSMRAGLIIEPGLIRHVEEARGVTLERDVFYRDDEHDFLAGSADAVDFGSYIVEVTTCGDRSRSSWGPSEVGSPSPMKACQAQWLMGLSGEKRARVVCLDKSTSELLSYWVDFDPVFFASLRATAVAFWHEHIEARVPPETIDGWGTPEHLDLIWPGDKTKPALVAGDEIQRQALEYDQARTVGKDAEERRARARAELHALLGDATRAEWAGGSVTLSPAGQVIDRIDWQRVALAVRDACRVSVADFQAVVIACSDRMPAKGRTIGVRLKKEEK